MRSATMKRLLFIAILVVIGVGLWRGLSMPGSFWYEQRVWMPKDPEKALRVTLDDEGYIFEIMTHARTVSDFLKEQHIAIADTDTLSASKNDPLYENKIIRIQRAKHIILTIGGEKRSITTYQTDTEKMLIENGIFLGNDDILLPKKSGIVVDGGNLSVIRVDITEQIVDKPIAFTKTEEEDATLSFRKTKVLQKGEDGVKRLTYRIISHDGKEIDRTMTKQEVIKDPVMEKTVQGTYVEVGKAHTGLGTWYAFTGTMAAASPWLPMGSYVKVTNQNNGKTVIVKINDRGPFGKNRILDLDKVAFAKIASIGAGIIPLKVEEITN